jgi:hypothetical protein
MPARSLWREKPLSPLSSPNFTSYKDITFVQHGNNFRSSTELYIAQLLQYNTREREFSKEVHTQICTNFHHFNCSSVQHKSDETKAIVDLFTLDHQVIAASLKTFKVKLTLVRNPGREKEYNPDLQFKQVHCSLHASHINNYKNRTQMQQNKSCLALASFLSLLPKRPKALASPSLQTVGVAPRALLAKISNRYQKDSNSITSHCTRSH